MLSACEMSPQSMLRLKLELGQKIVSMKKDAGYGFQAVIEQFSTFCYYVDIQIVEGFFIVLL